MNPAGYVGVLGAEEARQQSAATLQAAAPLRVLPVPLQAANATVMAGERCDILTLPNAGGVVLGILFDRRGSLVREVSPATAASWIASGGKAMLSTHWGAYLAILNTLGGPLVLRDPSGLFPCYFRHADGAVVFASDLDWLDLAGRQPRTICRAELHAQLQYFSRRSERTALEDIAELLPGTALTLDSASPRVTQLWSPYDFGISSAALPSFDEAAQRLQRAASMAIGAWAARYPHALVEVSGGLDSSIVAAVAKRRSLGLQAVTFRGSDADLDETRYAAALAEHLNIPLTRQALSVEGVDLRRSAAHALPRPTMRSFAQASDRQSHLLAQQLGSDAFFAGTGGDSVFWYFNTATPALDRLRVEGIAGFLETIGDLAAMCSVPRSKALAIALRKWLQRRPAPWPISLDFLSRDAREPAKPAQHPWWPPPRDTLPGIRAYVRAMIQVSDHLEHDLRAAQAPVIAPLVSQPIIECCLRTPSWLACTGGANRAVARAAFYEALPTVILERRTKGGFDGFAHRLLERNRAVAREMLLQGRLAQDGWLDTRMIEHCLADPAPIAPGRSIRLLRLIAVEAWLASVAE